MGLAARHDYSELLQRAVAFLGVAKNARARKARRAACLPILPFLAFALPQVVLAQRPEMIRAAGTRPTACVGESGARGTRRLTYFGSSTGIGRSPRRHGSDRSWLQSRDANRHLAGNSER